MSQLDVYRISPTQYALDCQSDLLNHLATRFVVPLLRPADVPDRLGPLHPVFDIAGHAWVMATHLAGAVSVRKLRDRITSLAEHDYVIQRAIDRLTSNAG